MVVLSIDVCTVDQLLRFPHIVLTLRLGSFHTACLTVSLSPRAHALRFSTVLLSGTLGSVRCLSLLT